MGEETLRGSQGMLLNISYVSEEVKFMAKDFSEVLMCVMCFETDGFAT